MQVTETAREGLKRTLQVVVGQAELSERFATRLDELKGRVEIKGFRRGKVPVAHIKKLYGKSLMQEVMEQTLNETSAQAIKDRNERPAQQPKVELVDFNEETFEKIANGQGDLAYNMSFEVLPPIPLADLSALKLEKLVADVDDEAVDKALSNLAERNTAYDIEEGRAASEGDLVTLDFVGKIDGEAFEGGSAEGQSLVIGKKQFIPGFEEGLVGLKAGDEKVVSATFPAEYPVAALAGKTAEFDVKVKGVSKSRTPAVDEDFAKGVGAESLEQLRGFISEQIKREYDQASRQKLKRELLDALDAAHTFELPASLVDFEFDNIWTQLENNLKATNKTFADEGKTEDEARAEYRKIAERRVRLGLVIGEIGEKNNLQVSQDELRRALVEQARRYPGQEKQVYEYYEKTPGALAELRAPIFEDKVIDFVVDEAKPTEKKVTRDELLKAVQEATEEQ
ncbi:trigger factor [Hyphomicrobium sp. MC1]|uniref:trigger factor n=1 Tax=Hyphomicrobium sp. (strain MC1) TaxID=717785 RepID=UPI000213F470|nr:trigger factor [Hyphomicrobium sp. MC1]CCB66137.1 trigger factor, molecular chaperone involved in cell division [Hyphomicrobium sp. MC1]